MAEIILERTGLTGSDGFHTIHNYIDTDEMILRKGAGRLMSRLKAKESLDMEDYRNAMELPVYFKE